MTPRRLRLLLLVALAAIAVLASLQVWSAFETRRVVEAAMKMPIGRDATDIERERLRQETIAKQIENKSKALLWTNLLGALVASLGLVLSIAGAVGTAFAYIESRERERTDRRDAQARDREDRLAAALNDTLTRLVSKEPRERKVGAAGLIYFFAPDRADFHLQAFAPLIAAASDKSEIEDVRRSLRLAIEQGIRSIDNAQLRTQSWKDVWLQQADLAGTDLSGLDFRDADLRDANLRGARLNGTDFTAAQLQGADLSKADLSGATLTYADLAGGSIAGALLAGTAVDGMKVLNLDVAGTRIGGDVTGWRDLPWEAARDWRLANFDPAIREELDRRYGEAAPDLHVLMLVWEMPPNYVAGGTWTACYHLVRKLRQRGANVTVVAPWRRDLIADTPFGVDVPIVGLDIVPPPDQLSPYGAAAWSPYAGPVGSPYGAPSWSPYGGGAWSPYGGTAPGFGSPYGSPAYGPYGGVPSWSPYGGPPGWSPYPGAAADYGRHGLDPAMAGSSLYRLMGEFSRRLQRYLADQKVDLIHAHDWVTFDAARTAAESTGAPWIAHFHSTETERQHERENVLTLRIEQMAVDNAARIIVPSQITTDVLVKEYHAKAERLAIVPNLLSERAPAAFNMGRFETKRVVYLGRLSRQKGADLFVAAVTKAREQVSLQAEIVGSGEEPVMWQYWINRRGAVPWEERSDAFRGASLVVVPSRFEPFGMVILEAMQHRVPVIYPEHSGAAEVLVSGVKADPFDSAGIAGHIVHLLGDLGAWEATVRGQADEIDAYPDRCYEDQVIAVWRAAVTAGGQGAA
ncbi:MAG: glycosyltransferase [Allosphingosinicella sp.]